MLELLMQGFVFAPEALSFQFLDAICHRGECIVRSGREAGRAQLPRE